MKKKICACGKFYCIEFKSFSHAEAYTLWIYKIASLTEMGRERETAVLCAMVLFDNVLAT